MPTREGASVAEMLAILVFLALLVAVPLGVVGTENLFERTPWVDETLTWLLIGSPDLGHMMEGISTYETNVPLLHLCLRAVTTVSGRSDMLVLRGFSFVAVLLGLAILYALMRRSVSVAPALVAVLTLWSHPRVQEHSVEARFYGPMLTGCLLVAWFLPRGETSRPRKRAIGLAVASVLLCWLHYFGVICLALLAAGAALADGGPFGQRIRRVLPTVAGPVSLLGALPIYLSQRGLLQFETWVPKPSMGQVYENLTDLFVSLGVTATLVVAALAICAGRVETPASRGRMPVALLTLLLLPGVLLVVSLILQPVLVPRFSLPGTLGMAAAAGMVASRIPRALNAVLVVGLIGICLVVTQQTDRKRWQQGAHYDAVARQIRTLTGSDPVLFETWHELMPLLYRDADLVPRCHFWDEGTETVDRRLGVQGYRTYLLRNINALHGRPTALGPADLARLQTLFFRAKTMGRSQVAERFPDWAVESVGRDLYRLQRGR